MNPTLLDTAWAKFIAAFFSLPNEISATGNDAVDRIIAQAEAAWFANPASPFALPVRASSWTYWYVICPDQDQQLWIRDLIQAYVGSWTNFSGQPVPEDSDLPLDQAVRTLIGSQGCSYRLLIPRDANAEARVRQGLVRMTRSLAARPYRRINLALPLGRLIGDFWDSCASGAEARTEEILNVLEKDHRLSRANKLFLRLQYLATFEHWDRLEQFEELSDLTRLDRPVMASDALARLAMARLPNTASLTDFVQTTSAYGCLLGSATMIRSAAGAQYYAYWSLSTGESAEVVAARLRESGWLDQANGRLDLAALLSVPDAVDRTPTGDPDLDELHLALDGGRLDAAIEVLGRATPSATLLPVLLELVTKTLSNRSIRLLQQWREQLVESDIQHIVSGQLTTSGYQVAIASEPLGETLKAAFAGGISATERARTTEGLRAQAVPRLMQAGVLREVVDVARPLSRSLDSSLLADLIDLLLDMERDLFLAAGDVPGIQGLRLTVIEAWALGDDSGDRHRATRLLDLVARTLTTGVSASVFDELVENLRAGWTAFLTDADLSLGLEMIEVLVATRPDAAVELPTFATQILSRVGPHNAHRINAVLLETAKLLASDFGLELAIPPQPDGQVTATISQVRPPKGYFVAIYSLVESAANRAAAIVRHWYPETRVEIFTDKVASTALRSAAKQADLLVIADRAAAHAATDALKKARGRKPIHYALGKGSASLVEAVLTGFEAVFGRKAP
ncbi:protein DpdD [Nonomuraea bangladeshensis]|uniref:Protein DpdD n=1 Tax=Nonomuraea bangladeshensis TaxID=404385 RepID=A0ABV3H7K2_9ACTN